MLIHNLSTTGLLLETAEQLAIGEEFVIDLPEAESRAARIVWTSGALFGCQFAEPLPASAVSAARLLSPADSGAPSLWAPGNAPVESFGARLRRLRKCNGLSVEALAGRIEMSTPTVYNWELGRVRPREAVLTRLAQVLGVTPAELYDGRGADASVQDGPARGEGAFRDPPPAVSPSRFGEAVKPEARLAQLIAASKAQIAALAGTTVDKVKIILEL